MRPYLDSFSTNAFETNDRNPSDKILLMENALPVVSGSTVVLENAARPALNLRLPAQHPLEPRRSCAVWYRADEEAIFEREAVKPVVETPRHRDSKAV